MWVKELHIKNFGKFSDKRIELSDGINLIYGENESGKSTVHTFIRSCLYGMRKMRGRASKKDDFSHYQPWDNSNYYAGNLRFVCGNKVFRLERDFTSGTGGGLLVCETDGELLSLENGDLDMLLGGVGEVAFLNTVSIGQLKNETDEGLVSELQNYIANYQESGDHAIYMDKALQALKQQKKELERQALKEQEKQEGKIRQLSDYMGYLNDEIRMDREKLQDVEHEIVFTKRLLEDIQKRQEENKYLRESAGSKVASLFRKNLTRDADEEVFEGDASYENERAEDTSFYGDEESEDISFYEEEDIEDASFGEDDLEEDDFYEDEEFEDEDSEEQNGGFFGKFGIPKTLLKLETGVLAVMLLFCYLMHDYGYVRELAVVMVLVSVVVVGGYWVIYNRLSDLRQEDDWEEDENEDEDEDGSSGRNIYDKDEDRNASDIAREQKETNAALNKLYWQREHLQGEIEERLTQVENYQQEMQACMEEFSDEKAQLQKENKAALEMAYKQLQKVMSQMQSSTGVFLKQRTSEIFAEITDGYYTQVQMEENLCTGVHTKDRYVPLEQLSRGTIWQVYFAYRMAVGELLTEEEPLPIMLDDAFVMYDEGRLAQVLGWLSKQEKQVLLFTCQKREKELFEQLGVQYHEVVL